jgi:mono/diheme cytochrome c family protein
MRRYTLIGLALVVVLALWLAFAPPRVWLNLTRSVDLSDPAATGAALVADYDCRDCHRIDGRGALQAPGLDDATRRMDRETIRIWLINPRAIDRNTAMPNFRLSDNEIEAIIAYLESLVME